MDFVYKDNDAFFQYQCRYGVTTITPGQALVAQVILDATDLDPRDDAEAARLPQMYLIKIASPGGGAECIAPCGQPGITLKPSDLVAWMPIQYNSDLRIWAGWIFAKIAPEIRDGQIVPIMMFPPS